MLANRTVQSHEDAKNTDGKKKMDEGMMR